jgi:hypothetical protein
VGLTWQVWHFSPVSAANFGYANKTELENKKINTMSAVTGIRFFMDISINLFVIIGIIFNNNHFFQHFKSALIIHFILINIFLTE